MKKSKRLCNLTFCVICNLEKLDYRGCIGAPDLIIEVLSPSTTKKDYYEKCNLDQENGVKEYRLANPEGKSIQIIYLDNHIYVELETFLEKVETIYSKLFPELGFRKTSIYEY